MLAPRGFARKSNERKMVIIKKFVHTQRQKVKSKKAFVSVLAIVLSLLMTVSVLFVAIPITNVSAQVAQGEYTDSEEIYIDLRSFTNWENDQASLKVFTFYNNSDTSDHYCREIGKACSNSASKNDYSGNVGYGITPDKFCDHVYRFRIPSDHLDHVIVVRCNKDANEPWNTSYYMYDGGGYGRNKTAGNNQNCIKITGWDSSQWSTFSPTNNASSSSKTASLDSSITSRSDLFTIDAKYYDYYNDDEIQKGWQNINYNTNHASVHNTKSGSWYWWNGYWEPFSYLNSKIAEHDSSVNYPLYFGNFYGKDNGYTGEGTSNLKNFNKYANNSNSIGGNHKSVSGLTGGTLDSSGDLVYAKNAGYNSSTKVPFFDESFLTGKKVGSVITSKFPMRKETSNGITNYKFDSTGAQDNVWISDSTGSSPKVHYNSGTSYGAKDSLYSYSDRESSGYGFFPFDSTRGASAEAKNYGFGMRVDVDFNLGSDDNHLGQIKGTDGKYDDQVFSFTGDDDVWVYVDGKLILDIGGDHKKATGTINFHNGTVTVENGYNFNNATRNTSFTLDGDATTEHTLTMFYVERGMIESNLSFNFNFAPVGNQLITEKLVNTTELNTGIKDTYALKNADKFTFTSSALNGKQYTYAHTAESGSRTGSVQTVNSNFNLRDKDTATFSDQLTVGDTVNVTESMPSTNALTYNKTSWVVVDTEDNNYVIAQSPATTAQSLDSSFVFKTHKTGTFDPTKLKLTFTNTPEKANAVIKKNVVDSNDNDVSDSKSFPATVYLSFDKGTTYKTYPLKYTVTGTSGTLTMSNGHVDLSEGKDITIPDLPVGTKVKVVETASSLGGYTNVSGDVEFTVTSGGATTTVTNKQPAPGETTQIISGRKTLDDQAYTGNLFYYQLKGLKLSGDASNAKDTSSVSTRVTSTSNGNFNFGTFTYSEAGIYRYYVYEDLSNLTNLDNANGTTYHEDIYQDLSVGPKYLVTITVTQNPTTFELTASDPVVVATNKEISSLTPSDFSGTSVPLTFNNKTRLCSVKIEKNNQAGEKVQDVKFALYKLTESDAESIETYSDSDKYDYIVAHGTFAAEEKTNTNGIASFSDLNIYEAGYASSSAPKYQNYALVEIGGNADYHINKTPQVFKFPTQGQYDYTFSYENGMIKNPYTAGNGMMVFRTIGLSIIGLALLTLAGFVLYRKRKFSLSRAKNARHYKK